MSGKNYSKNSDQDRKFVQEAAWLICHTKTNNSQKIRSTKYTMRQYIANYSTNCKEGMAANKIKTKPKES